MIRSKNYTDDYQTSMLSMRLGWTPVSTDPKSGAKCFSLSDIVDSLVPRRIRISGVLYWLSCGATVAVDGGQWDARYENLEANDWAFESTGQNLLDALVELAIQLKEYENEYSIPEDATNRE